MMAAKGDKQMSRIYVWKSAFFEDYHLGCIVVVATSLEDARAKALAQFEVERSSDPAVASAARDHAFMFHDDIKAEPASVTDDCVFIMGAGRDG